MKNMINNMTQRIIKFRAWDKNNKFFLGEPMTLIEIIECARTGNLNPWLDLAREFLWTQYTGLKDKNGIEIYEGDLLKHDLWGETEVIWDKEGACFRGKNEDHDITLAHHQLERSRVTGNIYEDKRS